MMRQSVSWHCDAKLGQMTLEHDVMRRSYPAKSRYAVLLVVIQRRCIVQCAFCIQTRRGPRQMAHVGASNVAEAPKPPGLSGTHHGLPSDFLEAHPAQATTHHKSFAFRRVPNPPHRGEASHRLAPSQVLPPPAVCSRPNEGDDYRSTIETERERYIKASITPA